MHKSKLIWLCIVCLGWWNLTAGLSAGVARGGGTLTFEAGKQPTREIHVAVSGDDETGDGSVAHPYASVGRAAQAATPGAAIRVHAGTYTTRAYVEGVAGTAAAPIWIGGAPGEARPVFEGDSEGLHISRARYLVIHDLEVRATADNGINCDDGGDYADAEATRYVVFRDLFIHHIGGDGNQDCLKLSGVNDYYVLNSEFAFCGGDGSGSGVDHVGCHRGVLANNEFHDITGNAVQCKGGSQDIEIRANRMRDTGERAVNMGGSTDFEYFRPPLSTTTPNAEARDIRLIANLIEGSVTPLAFVGCVECAAVNNTIINPTNWLLRILQETTTRDGYEFLPSSYNIVGNNLFYFDRSELSTYVNIGPDTAAETFTFTHNLWYAHDAPANSQPDLPATESGAVVGQDPRLAAPATRDYHLQAGSPARARGDATLGVAYDFEGYVYAAPPSIGALEGNRPTLTQSVYLPVLLRQR